MSTTTAVATRDGKQEVSRGKAAPTSVLEVFGSASVKRQVATALPKQIKVDSMMRIVLTEVRKNPELEKCTPASFMGALLTAAQLGLRPGYNGEAWIIPRWSGKLKCLEAQFQPGYRGLAQLAYRSGEVADVLAEAVYGGDHFEYSLGSDPHIRHVPDLEAEHKAEEIVAFYAVIKLVNGGRILKVMSRAEIDDVRDRFAPTNRENKVVGPWVTDYAAMGCKTVLLRALKFAPMESERLAAAIAAEEDALFRDRVASGVVERTSAAERVAERLGVEPETVAGEAEEEEEGGEAS